MPQSYEGRRSGKHFRDPDLEAVTLQILAYGILRTVRREQLIAELRSDLPADGPRPVRQEGFDPDIEVPSPVECRLLVVFAEIRTHDIRVGIEQKAGLDGSAKVK